MKTFKTEAVYDANKLEWIEIFFIDNQEVSAETYFEEMENETYQFCDVCENLIEECLCGDKCDCEDCCNCDEELSDEQQEEVELISNYMKRIYDVFPCHDCLCEALIQLLYIGKNIGFNDHKNMMRKLLED